MNRHSFRIACVVVVLVLGLAGTAGAQGRACSSATIRGAWGYTETGSVIAPTGAVVTAAAVGRYEFDNAESFEGAQYSSANGAVGADTKQGTYTINPDCTGTLALTAYRGGVAQRLSVWVFVIDGDGREMRAIMASMKMLPGEIPLSPIMTMTATKVFAGQENKQ